MAGSIVGVVKSGRWRAAKLNKDGNGTPAHQRRGTITFAVPLLCSAAVSARFVPSSDLPGRQDTPPQHGQPPPAGRVVRTSRIHPPARTFLMFRARGGRGGPIFCGSERRCKILCLLIIERCQSKMAHGPRFKFDPKAARSRRPLNIARYDSASQL